MIGDGTCVNVRTADCAADRAARPETMRALVNILNRLLRVWYVLKMKL